MTCNCTKERPTWRCGSWKSSMHEDINRLPWYHLDQQGRIPIVQDRISPNRLPKGIYKATSYHAAQAGKYTKWTTWVFIVHATWRHPWALLLQCISTEQKTTKGELEISLSGLTKGIHRIPWCNVASRQGKIPTGLHGSSQTRLSEGTHRIIWYHVAQLEEDTHWAALTVWAGKGISRSTWHLQPFLIGREKPAWYSLGPKSLACVKASTSFPHIRSLRSIKDTHGTGLVLMVQAAWGIPWILLMSCISVRRNTLMGPCVSPNFRWVEGSHSLTWCHPVQAGKATHGAL